MPPLAFVERDGGRADEGHWVEGEHTLGRLEEEQTDVRADERLEDEGQAVQGVLRMGFSFG